MTFLVVAFAGAAGAVCRYLVSGWAQMLSNSGFPVGTLTVNLSGSLAVGLVAGAGSLQSPLTIGAIGFLSGFTTYSTWMVETVRLGAISPAATANLVATLVGGVALAGLGYTLTM